MNDRHNKMKNEISIIKDYRQEIYHQSPLKMLSFLSKHPKEMFCEKEIVKSTALSSGSTNQTLRLLLKLGVVRREKKGNLFLYSIDSESYILKYFKIFETLLYINDFIKEVQPYSYEIILYGSCAQGINTAKSDIDIFVKTECVSEVKNIVSRYKTIDENIKAVVLDLLEIASSKKADEVFYNEVKKGIVLWRGKPAYEEV